jgi:ATP-binding cassette subfamily C protein LapB
LFSGTVRENLVLGLIDPGDDAVLAVAKKTGLFESLIAPHPQGLLRPIFEGGMGLSGGQKQLVNVTKALLRDSSIWLLDEPTASMDQSLEVKILSALSDAIATEHTLVLVTHKAELLELVDRVVVVANNTVVMDGPKEVVLQKLGAGAKQGGMA